MPNLFALLVAIEKYDRPNVIQDLKGPVNDLEGMEFSLDIFCRMSGELTLHKKVLKNKQATRQGIIDAFELFNDAVDQDVCLFYFSGHGAQISAPAEFGYEPDEMLEALVCHIDKGNDNLLIDKELSYLIAKAQRGKEVHFVIITDSCHSGSNTKDPTFRVRSAPSNLDSRAVDMYLGRSEYTEIKNAEGAITCLRPPIGKHLKLGACASSELAKEKILGDDDKTRGVFTYALLQVLKENGSRISYANLVAKARIKTQVLTRDQSPQIETTALPPQEYSRFYLNGLLEGGKPAFQVSYKQRQSTWVINVGHMFGVRKEDIALLENGAQARIREVYASDSLLDSSSLSSLDKNKVFDATIESHSRKHLNLAFAPGSDESARRVLLGLLEETPSSAISFDERKGVDYVVHAVDNILALTHPEGKTPVFSRIPGQGKAEARLFLNLVEQVAEWHRIIAIANPDTTISEDEIGIERRDVENPHQYPNPDLATPTLLADWRRENVFRYTFDDKRPGDPWRPPAFRLSIANHSDRLLIVSALYCGSGYVFDRTHYTSTSFSITNQFLEREELAKRNQVAKMMDEISDPQKDRHVAFESIQLSLLDDYFDRGYNEVKDLVKVFVSTDELDTSCFNMKGIPIDIQGVLGKRFLGIEAEESDWRTFEVPITIVKPRDLGFQRPGQDKSFYGLTIAGHPAFSAQVILSTFEEFARSIAPAARAGAEDSNQNLNSTSRSASSIPRPEILYGNENVCMIELTDGLGDVQGCSVIEFYRAAGVEAISATKPLRFIVDPQKNAVDEKRKLMIVGYSPNDRTYCPLGIMDAQQQIDVVSLPYASSSLIDGLGNSIKLLLLSVRTDFEVPLCVAHLNDTKLV